MKGNLVHLYASLSETSPAGLHTPRIAASDSPRATVAEWLLGRADADQVP